MTRVCITSNDIQMLTGKSERQSRNILKDIKVFYKKEKHQLVTVDELAAYLGIDKELISRIVK